MNREQNLNNVRDRERLWDVVIIGGGATGVGVALDAASRGLQTLLVEQSDFGKGTSSRSTKLVHGGVRYLQQGNITLVRDALRERTLLRQNAPHLVRDMPFLIPCQNLWQRFFYGFGLKIYDLLATGDRFGRSQGVSAKAAIQSVPTINRDRLRGGVVYHDGQFDDSRLLIDMVRSAQDHGATLVNYVAVTNLIKDQTGKTRGVELRDAETSQVMPVKARCVVNATGPFCDSIRRLDDEQCEPMLAASQGVHVVLARRFFPGDMALIVPKTSDGRVIFLIPWHGHVVVGTTDTPIDSAVLEPAAQSQEIDFLLQTTSQYLTESPTRDDVLSVFTGIRPLVKGDKSARTASLSRDHVIRVSDSGLVTITGGKWTTVRKMAEDCVDRVVKLAELSSEPCQTKQLRLHGYLVGCLDSPRAFYGADLAELEEMERSDPELAEPLHSELLIRGSDVVWAVRHEMARTVDDVLSRRTRSLFLNANAAISIAPQVAALMAATLGKVIESDDRQRFDQNWIDQQVNDFVALAKNYQCPTS